MAQLLRMLALSLAGVAIASAVGYKTCVVDARESIFVTNGYSQMSPSGKFNASVAVVDERGAHAWRVVVSDQGRQEVYRSPMAFSSRHRTAISWEERVDRLWVYSGDIGTRIYETDSHGAWIERSPKGLTPPAAFRKIYDQLGI